MRQLSEGQAGKARALGGRVLAGGAHARTEVARLLGVEAPNAVEAAAWVERSVRAAVRCGGPESVVFTIAARDEGARGLVETASLVVHHGHTSPGKAFARHLARVAAARLADHDIESLAALFQADPELGAPGLPMPPLADSARPRSLLDTWGEGDAWADFFATDEIARAQLDSLDPSKLFVLVQHGDSECEHVNPHSIAPIRWLVEFPWEQRVRTDRAVEAPLLMSPEAATTMLTSDLRERDVIMGNPDRLRRVLQSGAALSRRKGKTLFVANTCLPMVVGEDVASEFDRCRGCCDKPPLYLTVTPRSMVNVFHDILVTHRQDAEARAEERPAGGRVVNLIGFAATRDTAELGELLGVYGVEVGEVLLPALDYDAVARLPRAALNVCQGNTTWAHLIEQLTRDSSIPHTTPSAPYGFDGTRRWLRAVADALALDVDHEALWEGLSAPLRDRWQALQREAAGHRLGLVLRAAETHYLTDPRGTWGVPLVAALEELGFGLDVLLLLRDRDQAKRAAGEIHALFAAPDRHTIKGFNSRAMLAERLAASDADAFFSCHTFDHRLTAAGKSAFSLQHFELGLAGALRTGERLLGSCRLPFYRRYARFLGRTATGTRRSPEETG